MENFKKFLRMLKRTIKMDMSLVQKAVNAVDLQILALFSGSSKKISENKTLYTEFTNTHYFSETKALYYDLDSIIRAFDNEKCVGKINDFTFLFFLLSHCYALKSEKIFDICKIFGSAVKFNSLKYYKNDEALLELSKYFDLNGNFTDYHGESFLKALKNVVDFEKIHTDDLNMSFNIMTTVMKQFDTLQKVIRSESKKLKEEPKIIPRKKSEYVKEEIKQEIVEDEKFKFLTDEEKISYEYCSANITRISYRGDYSYYLEAIRDLQSLDELYDELSLEERENIKNEIFDKLNALMLILGPSVNNREKNVIFLQKHKNSFYFSEDALTIDKSLRKKIPKLIEKIKNDVNFRIVLDSNIKRGELLFVNDANLTVTFCKLSEDTILVIGLHLVNKGLSESIKRYLFNKDFIDNLKENIKNDVVREELVKASESLVLKREK